MASPKGYTNGKLPILAADALMGKAYETLLENLRSNGYKVQARGRDRARSQCPAHGGDDLNLSIAVGDQGALTKCHSHDCPAEDIAIAVGLTLTDLFDEGGRAVYDYGGGHRVIRKRTRDGKQVMQSNKPATTSLYRHPDSEPIETWGGYVVLVEGEKCVDAALRLGERCVTTWPGGANGVGQVDLTPLAGKYVRIIADNDEPGLKAASRLVSRLAGIATIESIWTAANHKESVDDIWLSGGTLADLVPAQLPMDEQLEPAPEPPARSLSLRSASSLQSKRTRFLWDRMIPQSAVTLCAGRGGVAKSTFAIWLAGRLNRGELPGELVGKQSAVLYVSHEDSPEEVVLPRIDANGAERELFHFLSIQSKEVGGFTVPRLPEDMPLIREAIAATDAKLLIIDPITSTLAGGDNDKMADVRQVMDPLNQMAAELGVSVIGIAHFRKGGGSQADLISGSHAWRDASRAVMLFARDEETNSTVMTLEKINSGEAGKSFRYRLDIVQQLTDEGTLTDVGRIVWEGDSATSVGDIINHESERTKQGSLANELLEHIKSFEGRAVSTDDMVKLFAVDGVKPNTVRQNLKRMAARGAIVSPAYGVYQAPPPSDPLARARGGVTPVTSVTSLREVSTVGVTPSYPSIEHRPENRTKVTSVTPVTPPRARAHEDDACHGCGYPLPSALVAAGEVRHATC